MVQGILKINNNNNNYGVTFMKHNLDDIKNMFEKLMKDTAKHDQCNFVEYRIKINNENLKDCNNVNKVNGKVTFRPWEEWVLLNQR